MNRKRSIAGGLVLLLILAGIVWAAVNPVTPPDPPNSDLNRAVFVWGAGDELGTDQKSQAVLNHCRDHGANVVFLDTWRYLGGGNWSDANETAVRKFVDAAHRSGIRVYALSGNVEWGQNHAWVMENIVQRWIKYQTRFNATYPASRLDGCIYDVEYWTDEQTYPPAQHLPGLCDLIRATRSRVGGGFQVGVFGAFFLKDDTGTRAGITYNGKTAQDGEHLMDAADFVVVGSYRDTAANQLAVWTPWRNYAQGLGRNFGLYVGVETTNVSPASITYYGEGKTYMEGQLTTISSTARVTSESVYMGAAIHDYTGWKAMGN